jgi:hypothetical protein
LRQAADHDRHEKHDGEGDSVTKVCNRKLEVWRNEKSRRRPR